MAVLPVPSPTTMPEATSSTARSAAGQDAAGCGRSFARARFRRWRRSRPFWGGLWVALGGAAILLAPLAPLPLIIRQGVAGVSGYLVGALLVAVGLLSWAQSAQRAFLGVAAMALSLASFVTSNFGGFGAGKLRHLVGAGFECDARLFELGGRRLQHFQRKHLRLLQRAAIVAIRLQNRVLALDLVLRVRGDVEVRRAQLVETVGDVAARDLHPDIGRAFEQVELAVGKLVDHALGVVADGIEA